MTPRLKEQLANTSSTLNNRRRSSHPKPGDIHATSEIQRMH